LGSCRAVGRHANAVHRGWIVRKLELELEGDLNISAVWGTGDVSEKPVGFTDVRVKVDMECDGVPPDEIDALIMARPAEGRISNEAPVGRALLGRKKGERIKVRVPAGDFTYTIVKIS